MLMVGSSSGLGAMLDGLAAYHGHRSDPSLARAMKAAGYQISHQAVNNYRRGKKKAPASFMVAFINTLGIEGEQRTELINAWLSENQDVEELYRFLDGMDSSGR